MAAGVSAVNPVRQKNLTCAVCQEIYRSPRLLPCFHSLCLVCIEGLANEHGCVFPCPVCREATQVPVGGVGVFQPNFYITEEELQLAKNSTEAAICPKHSTELVVFLCKVCDEAICIRCKLLQHNQHDCEDLSDAATGRVNSLAAGATRLQNTISRLTKQLHLAKDNVNAAQKKRAALKEQIESRRDLLMVKVSRWHDEAVQNIDSLADTLETQLKENEKQVQHELDSLLPLRECVQYALDSASDADIVAFEREVRVGLGSKAALAKAETKAQQNTHRPGLHCDILAVTDDDLHLFLGAAVTLVTPSLPRTETITKIYRFGNPGEFREIHDICPLNTDKVCVAYGGVSPDYLGEQEKKLNITTNTILYSTVKGERFTTKRYAPGRWFATTYRRASDDLRLNSKSATMIQCDKHCTADILVMYRIAIQSRNPFCKTSTIIFRAHANVPLAFDVCKREENFVLLEENPVTAKTFETVSRKGKTVTTDTPGKCPTDEAVPEVAIDYTQNEDGRQATGRLVHIYRKPYPDPISTYTPPESTFCPSDVCFWTVRGEEKLLIADWMNDAIHVVRVDSEGTCHFECYLAAGHGDLVKPSALNTDTEGRLWIGCSNGWLLRCEEADESDNQEDMVPDKDSTEVGSEPDRNRFLESDLE